MTDREGAAEGRPVRRHARPSEPAVPWPGGDGAAPNGAVPSGSAAPGGSSSGSGPLPADYGMMPDRHGTVPNYALPPNPGGQAPARHVPPGRHAGQDGSADGPDRAQGSYQGMRRSPDSVDPTDTPRPSRSSAPDARPPGGPAPRSPGRADPLTDPSYAWPGSGLARPAQPQPDTSRYGRPQPSSFPRGGGSPRDGGYPRGPAPAGPDGMSRDGHPRDGGYRDDGRSPRDGRNRRDRGNPRNVEDPRGAAFPPGRGPARADTYRSDRGPFGDEDLPPDRGYEQGDRPPGNRPRGDHQPEDPFQRGELYDPNDSGDLDDPGGRYPAGRGYPQDEPEPEPGAYRGRRRGKASSAPDAAPGPGRDRRDDHVAHHAEGPPRDEAYPDDAYADDRFVPGLGGPRDRDDDEEDDGGERRGRRAAGRPGRRRSRWIAPLVALVVILTPLVIGGVYVLHLYISKYHPADYASDGTGQAIVQVQSGQTATAVGQRLVTLGVVASVRAFELAAEHSTDQRGLEPGFYRMHKQMKATLAFALLLNPAARIQDKITIPEGWRISQTEAELAAKSGIPAADYKQALANPGSLGLPSYADGNPEGYLWPATYDVQPNMSAAIVLQQMVASFNQEAAKINLTTVAAQAHTTPAQVITVASLLQAEGGRLSDYPKISRVIANRRAAGMPLQFDSTVLYGLGQFGTTVTEQQIHSNTPYNTYLHKGLPPGPIDSPGNAAIEAALHPAAGNWLYFVTEKNGVTNFSSTLAGLGG